MKKFFEKCILLAVPFIVYLIIIAVIDPFNFLEKNNFLKSDEKVRIAKSIEPHLFKVIAFQNEPKKNIVLGDSRTEKLFSCMESNTWGDLAFGGGSLKEAIDAFWWATNQTALDTVIIGANLNLYNKYNKRFWVEETIERKKTFFSYAFSKYVFHSTFLTVKYLITNTEEEFWKLNQTKEEFWSYQLNDVAAKFYEQFDYPDAYFNDLNEISDYCLENDIKLIFWIPPTHVELQKRKSDFGLERFDEKFIADLKLLGDLYNFDYDSELTRNKNHFNDPMHFNHEVCEIIKLEIFNESPVLSKYYKKTVKNVIDTE